MYNFPPWNNISYMIRSKTNFINKYYDEEEKKLNVSNGHFNTNISH